MADGVDRPDGLRIWAQSIEQPAGGDRVRHGDGGPQNTAVGAHLGDRLSELGRCDRSDLAVSLDSCRGEAGVEQGGSRLAIPLRAEQQQPDLGLTRGRTA